MAPDPAPTPRPLRADAERNRRRILDAARELFAAKGLEVGLDEIARHAGVGVGTAYRRFPSKDDLLDEVFEDRLDALVATAEGAVALTDPLDALRAFLGGVHEHVAADRTLRTLVLAAEGDRFEEIRARMQPIAGRLLRRAQRAGVVRRDVRVTDLPVMTMMVGAAADATRAVRPDAWRRFSALLLDALLVDPDARRPLPVAPLDQAALAALRVGTD